MKPIVRGSITRRLFLFNILLVFMPVAGFFSLSMYEDRLLASLEESMVQQGRIIAAWLAKEGVSADTAGALIRSLERKHSARIRIIGTDGTLLADSATQDATKDEPTEDASVPYETDARYSAAAETESSPESTLVYRLFSLPVRFMRNLLGGPPIPLASADYYSLKTVFDGPEIRAALSGSYGAVYRISTGGQNSVTLYSAIPVDGTGEIGGAVLISQSTWKILKSLYDFRLETAKIFLWSLAAAAFVSVLLALTICRPLSRLRREAEEIVSSPDGPSGAEGLRHFHLTGRNDEIDRLSTAFSSLLDRLRRQIGQSEHFASDAAHEMRNRLAGIRNSAELLSGSRPEELPGFAHLILESTARMERVLADLRELSRLEAGKETDSASVDRADGDGIEETVRDAIAQAEGDYPRATFVLDSDPALKDYRGSLYGTRLRLCLDNLLGNAASFSPPGGTVFVRVSVNPGLSASSTCSITVADEGPGIPDAHLSRVFDRFFTWRESNPEEHTGIGLALVEAAARKAGGSVSASNRPEGGAEFAVMFPVFRHTFAAISR